MRSDLSEVSVEPCLVVADELVAVLNKLSDLEPLFHAAAPQASVAWFEDLVAPEFWEVGASGRRYSRSYALSVLKRRQHVPNAETWTTTDFHVSEVAADHYLLTYRLSQPGRVTLRMTLWRRAAEKWQAVYHQGTVVQDGA